LSLLEGREDLKDVRQARKNWPNAQEVKLSFQSIGSMIKKTKLIKAKAKVLRNYLTTNMGWLKKKEQVALLGKKPKLFVVLRIIGADYLPDLEMLRVEEFKIWLLNHIDTLVDKKNLLETFTQAIEEWLKKPDGRAGNRSTRAKKQTVSPEREAMQEVLYALQNDPSLVEELVQHAVDHVNHAVDVYWLRYSNINLEK
jgi:hypothetical protein